MPLLASAVQAFFLLKQNHKQGFVFCWKSPPVPLVAQHLSVLQEAHRSNLEVKAGIRLSRQVEDVHYGEEVWVLALEDETRHMPAAIFPLEVTEHASRQKTIKAKGQVESICVKEHFSCLTKVQHLSKVWVSFFKVIPRQRELTEKNLNVLFIRSKLFDTTEH